MNIQQPVPTIYGNWREKYAEAWTHFSEFLSTAIPHAVEAVLLPQTHAVDIPTAFFRKEEAFSALKQIKEVLGYAFLTDYTATDENEEKRFHVVLHLMSVETKARVRIKIKISENESMPTLIPIWEGANWAEREIFDMFGIRFDGHPDLRRILMDVRWEGHPLRKDYPLRGYQVFLTPEPLDAELFK